MTQSKKEFVFPAEFVEALTRFLMTEMPMIKAEPVVSAIRNIVANQPQSEGETKD